MPVPRQPSARYQMSSTGIAPCLQLARYTAVCKYWHDPTFPAGVELYSYSYNIPLVEYNVAENNSP